MSSKQSDADQLLLILSYAGFILVAFELVKGMIVNPIKAFYFDTTFGEDMPFKSYKRDVTFRHKNEFEASLLYLRDFMEVIDSEDVTTIQSLRKHRNDLAHELPKMLNTFNIDDYLPLLKETDKALFKLSNHRAYMEIGSGLELQNKGIDWNTLKGHEYLIFQKVLEKINELHDKTSNA